jgi:lysophospholipase L1-like esterase
MEDTVKPTKTYLALGDSMSISAYTGHADGGAVAQLYKRLQTRQDTAWRLIDESYDGCVMAGVPLTQRPGGVDLITCTIGGNDLLLNLHRGIDAYRPEFEASYRRLMGRLQKLARRPKPSPEAIEAIGKYRCNDVVELLAAGKITKEEAARMADEFTDPRRIADEFGRDAAVIVGNIYHPLPGTLSDHLLAALDGVNAFIGEQVRKYGHRLADIAGAFLGNEERYLVMNIEPNLAGATEIARLFEEAYDRPR